MFASVSEQRNLFRVRFGISYPGKNRRKDKILGRKRISKNAGYWMANDAVTQRKIIVSLCRIMIMSG